MTQEELARVIDHTLLKAEATEADVRQVVAEAVEHRFASVCVHPRWTDLVAKLLEAAQVADEMQTDRPVKTCAVVGFPMGANTTSVKAIEAAACVKAGAQEVDMVISLASLLENDLDYARHDVFEVVRAARAAWRHAIVKVILETALLNEEQIALGCRAVREGGADYVKTSTGLHPCGGATLQAVRWLRQYAGDEVKVKAAGGIRDYQTAVAMLEAGADRIGCSASVAVIRGASGAGK